MYLQFLIYLAYFFIVLFVGFLVWALKWSLLKRFWQVSKIKAQNQKDKKDWIAKNEARGLKRFEFDHGNTIIYARTGNQALLDYKRLNQETKIIRKQLKKR